MKHIEIKKIPIDIINDYLDYKNLKINRIYSSNKSQIKRLDHYLWWFKMKNKRKSFIISKKKNFYLFPHQIILSLKITNLFTLV